MWAGSPANVPWEWRGSACCTRTSAARAISRTTTAVGKLAERTTHQPFYTQRDSAATVVRRGVLGA